MEVDMSGESFMGSGYGFSRRAEPWAPCSGVSFDFFRRFCKEAEGEEKHPMLLPQLVPFLALLTGTQREKWILSYYAMWIQFRETDYPLWIFLVKQVHSW